MTCEYVARPIGGINTKAAMLDILANCMEIASPEAVFWGGGHRFMITPHMYPFGNGVGKNSVMDQMYAGKIFGKDGAIATMLSGLKSIGQDPSTGADGQSSFEWNNVLGRLGDIMSQTVGAVGSLLQSVSSALFGDSSQITNMFGKMADVDSTGAGKSAVNNMLNNLNKMWSDHVIQQTTMPSIAGMKALLSGEPVGNWHLTVGNPLNPILVCGNLICSKMDVQFSDELGPDDFPVSMKVTYTIDHGMARDKAGIQSMFNRGDGKIYKLPDYVRATSDYESRVDDYTGYRNPGESWAVPQFMNAAKMQSMTGAAGYQTFKYDNPTVLQNSGNADTTFIAKFTPPDPQRASTFRYANAGESFFMLNKDSRTIMFPNLHTQKSTDN